MVYVTHGIWSIIEVENRGKIRELLSLRIINIDPRMFDVQVGDYISIYY